MTISETITLFFKGLVIGFSIAAPVGPIGILCIRRTLNDGRLCGFFTGMGAATADAVYGSIAAFGLTFISSFLVYQQTWLRLVGGLFLLYLGVKTFLACPPEQNGENRPPKSGLLQAYGSTFFLTLTNPMTILSFAVIFAGLGLAQTGSGFVSAGLLVLGVFSGSAFWWLLLSGGFSLLSKRINYQSLVWINRISGLIITGFGVYALFSIL